MSAIASQTTSLTIVYSTVYPGADQSKHQSSSASLAFVWGIHRWPVNSPHKWPVTRKMFPFDDVIMIFTNQAFSLVKKHNDHFWIWSFYKSYTVFLSRQLGQPIRLLLSYVGEEFEEERYTCGEGNNSKFYLWWFPFYLFVIRCLMH